MPPLDKTIAFFPMALFPLAAVNGGEEARLRIGFVTASGLAYCRGDMSFYLTLLEDYAVKAPDNAKEIQGFYEAGDLNDYSIRVHSLKSPSRLIGAQRLADLAEALEKAAKEGDTALIDQKNSKLVKMYCTLSEAILVEVNISKT